MPGENKKIVLGFIAYGQATAKYLPYFLPSLKAQTADVQLVCADNSLAGENENEKYIRENFPEIKFIQSGKNLGFAKAYNLMINGAIEEGADYFIAVNPDMIFEADFIEKIVMAIETDKEIGAVAPKILKWDFKNNIKTSLIDSCGLYITKEHRFSDLRQGEDGEPQTPRQAYVPVFGFTGAAVIFNLAALLDAAFFNGRYNEYFDELMFMYKEDCDLSYRLRLAGWKIIFAPDAVAYHDRTASPKGESNLAITLNRKNKSRQIKEWSFLNQWILLIKYSRLPFSRRVRFRTGWYQFKSLAFALFFEPYLLRQIASLWKIRYKIFKRRGQLKIRTNIKEIEKFML
ncbi:MAG: glycosyltransferase family 2 protein [Patescibacteria group bacterium]|jgi:GT2 family glycosyltransferase